MDSGASARSSTSRRRQQRMACDTCRRRKTRCNVVETTPCSVCARSKIPCRSTPEWSRPRSRRRRSTQVQSDPVEPAAAPETTSPHPMPSEAHQERPTDGGFTDESPPELAPIVTERDRVVDGLARNVLSQFYQRGVDSTHWTVFADSDHIRLAYMGTATSNIAHLISLKRVAQPSLHFPYPPIRPPLPWKPEGIWGSLNNIDIAHDTARFPAQEIRDALVDAFFEKIFPGFPIVDEITFRRQYASRTNPPPLLLFQAVLLAGSHACEHPTVAASRMVVKRTLFRRASMLFHIRHENDRLQMAQAALLFVWHLENSDSVCGGSYYWLGIAQRIAFGMGMHRDLSRQASSRLPAWERRLNRRIWWTLFQMEVFSCLEHGRPCMINWNDTDQSALELQDFIDDESERVSERVQLHYITRNIDIAVIGFRILQVNAPSVPSEEIAALVPSIEKSLVSFALDLPPMTDFWSCQLRMHYNLVLIHLHRPQSATSPPISRSPNCQEICRDASQAILSCLETIVHRGWTGQCLFTAVAAVMAGAIQMSLDARQSLQQGSLVLALNAQDRLARLLRCARVLENFWPSAGAVHGLFDQLSAELKDLAARTPQSSPNYVDVPQGSELPVEWILENPTDLFNFAVPPDLVPGDWMNDACFLNGSLG
ncbi:hypothetical protein P168DRAFT_232916 [Aspergillus campestris IBT 28561]|uniref:Zn(2)-C6 fungal-type domain-containing protein n=1 Tax=Aspergillus campestris (strain IBT 28561) TaxID=1392248 RepID=A0A2I1D7Z2_ASPC2|nr:uncharacterized protein P168DRAFT_232916 [Aspergillus campestris IBT 28561]PKY05990.1 hypothetical protein P168DRAFT_232916 [Aspergillus campestris IBT 28561]